MLSKNVYKERRKKIARAIGKGAVAIIPPAEEQLRNGKDNARYYRQNSDSLYVGGFSEPEVWWVIIGGTRPETHLFCMPKRTGTNLWFLGQVVGPKKAKNVYGADYAYASTALERVLPTLLHQKKITELYTPSACAGVCTKRIEHIGLAVQSFDKSVRTKVSYHTLDTILHEMRLIKDKEEQACMRKVAKETAGAHRAVMEKSRSGMNEREIAGILSYEFLRRGGHPDNAYTSIVAGGERGCTLHYVQNDMPIHGRELVLIDAGMEIDGYGADITRTFPINGRFTKEQREIYDIVLKAQEKAIEEAMPDKSILDSHRVAVQVITKGLVRLGLLKGTVSQLVKSGAYSDFFPHSTSHWLGLDPHDVGEYKKNGAPRKLEEGMVLTIEPAVYIRQGMKGVPKRYQGIAVRIEDDVLITKNGNEVLTKDAPKTVEEIERVMKRTEE